MARRHCFLEKGASRHFRNVDQDIGMHSPIEDLEWPILRALDSHWRSAWLLDRRPAFYFGADGGDMLCPCL